MTVKELLDRAEEHVAGAEYFANRLARETDGDRLMKLSLAKLVALEEDAWKDVQHIDDHLVPVREAISSVCYYDELEMSTSDKLSALVGLNGLEDKIYGFRRKLTDDLIRKIVSRKCALLLAANLRRRGSSGDIEED